VGRPELRNAQRILTWIKVGIRKREYEAPILWHKVESLMLRLAMILYSLIGTTLAGSAIVVALVIGQDGLQGILVAAILGALAALPVSLMVARRLYAL
jgi:hypothetical protein